jgi:hypothetical protein
MSEVVKIVKVGAEDTPIKPVEDLKLAQGGKKHKTLKTFPRGILKKTQKAKIKPVVDPAKHPPIKRSLRKQTIRLTTDKGISHRRKTIRQKISKMSDDKVKILVKRSGLLKNPDTPVTILREMLEGGMIAGFVSSD